MNAEEQNGHEETTGTREIGAALARRRREKGLSLRDVENATKIRTRYLEGLEQEDYGSLPDPVYIRGFLKTYANFLGLDGEELSREFKESRGPRRERYLNNYESPTWANETEQPSITPSGLGEAERRRISGATLLTIVLAVLILAAVAGSLYLVGSLSAPEPTEEPAKEEEQQEQPAEDQPEEVVGGSNEAAENTTPEISRATVRVDGSSTGMTVRTDGTIAYEGTAPPGFSREFEAQSSLNISAVNGGVVEVEVDGRDPERLANPGEGATRDIPLEESGG